MPGCYARLLFHAELRMPSPDSPLDFLPDGGHAGRLLRSRDWSATPLGPPRGWPQSLRSMLSLLLQSRQPMYLAWGPQLTSFYNDSYISICGDKHPAGFGRPYAEMFPELVEPLRDVLAATLAGQPQWFEDSAVPLAGKDGTSARWFSYSWTPLQDDHGETVGFFCVTTETTDKVLALLRLADEREGFAQLFDQAPTFMAVLRGPSHRFELVNAGYLRLIGGREVIGKTVQEALPEAVTQGYLEVLDRVYATGQAFSATDARFEMQAAPLAAPVERFVDFVYQPVKDAYGQVTSILVGGVDVTDRALADRALRESEARLRALNADLEHEVLVRLQDRGMTWQVTADLLGVLNADGFFEKTNPAWQALLGWSEEEIRRIPIFQLMHPEDVERTRGGFDRMVVEGEPAIRFENRYRCRDGSYKWLSWMGVPEGGRYYCSGRDITADKERDALLAARTAALDRVWRNSRDLLVTMNADGVFHSVNPAWETVLGHAVGEVLGKNIADFVWPEEAEPPSGSLATAAAKDDLTDFEVCYRHKDGTPRWISWHTSVENGVTYAYGRDITAARQAKLDLDAAQEALRQSQKMEAVGQLTGGIAHDFNNLLAGISASLELLEKRIAQGRVAGVDRYISLAQGSTRRAAALTQRLLAFSRRQTLDPKATDVNRLVAGMEELIRRTMGPAVRTEVVGAGGLWTTLVDPSQLENALLNLCINARDAMMPGGGHLTIETANKWLDERAARARELPPGQYVSLCVTDTGTGMTPEVIERAFDPFFTTKPLGEGTGLGLSMIYGFVRQSGGQVRVYSELGSGTTMCIYLPRHFGDAESTEQAATLELTEASTGETVMVVDDEATVRQLAVEVLEEMGYHVVEAADGPTGIRLLQSDARIDLLVTDVGLPGGTNGRQMADVGRMLRPELKVLFITGYAENAVVGNGHLAPGMQVMTKPFELAAFGNKVREMIEAPREIP